MKKDINILYVRHINRTFTENDKILLQKHFNIKVLDTIIRMDDIKLSLKSIINLVRGVIWSDITFSWFADTHSYLAVLLSKLFSKKSIVVIGGYEVAKVKEINYGSIINEKSANNVKYILNNADIILGVSEFNKKEIMKYTNRKDVKLIYNGINFMDFKPAEIKKNLVITVAYISSASIKRKQLDIFLKISACLPDIDFLIIGEFLDNSIEYLKKMAPPNASFTGFVSKDRLIYYYQNAKVYCQLSRYESFGVGLAEAMACGCVPVVTKYGALPEVVGDTGFYIDTDNAYEIAETIKLALASNKGQKARERIINEFSLERRETALLEIIKTL